MSGTPAGQGHCEHLLCPELRGSNGVPAGPCMGLQWGSRAGLRGAHYRGGITHVNGPSGEAEGGGGGCTRRRNGTDNKMYNTLEVKQYRLLVEGTPKH